MSYRTFYFIETLAKTICFDSYRMCYRIMKDYKGYTFNTLHYRYGYYYNLHIFNCMEE